jgi:hypothetical protein
MYKIVPWNKDLDLSNFYQDAEKRGFFNNASEKMLIGSFKNEKEKQVWILYYNDEPIGSVAAHSLDIFSDQNSYRIAARTCVFSDKLPLTSLRTPKQIIEHQHVTAQLLIPACIEWAGIDKNLYITSHPSPVGTQKLVHNIFCPLLERSGVLKKIVDKDYRGHVQTFWKLEPQLFLDQLNKFGRWSNG